MRNIVALSFARQHIGKVSVHDQRYVASVFEPNKVHDKVLCKHVSVHADLGCGSIGQLQDNA